MFDLANYHSCQYCQKFVIDLNNNRPPGDVEYDYREAINSMFFFDATLKDVLKGASDHCQLCVWLDGAWGERYGNRYRLLAKASAERVTVCAESYSMTLIDRYPIDELLFIGLWEHDAPVDPKLGKCRIRCGVLDVLTPKDDPASQFIWTRPINCRPYSAENLALARRWLEECLHSHPKCWTEQSSMPTRILRVDEKISGEFEVSIEYTYDKPCKTTKSTMKSMKLGNLRLPCEKLAKSVQDAIKVTVGLGLKYLWVDALYIVQDDDEDKVEQIADMPRIYNQACITIVAARSDRATMGFLDEIDLAKTTRLAVKLPFRCPDQNSILGSTYITYIDDSREPDPIHFRAWTLQERYLSNRYLEFGRIQMRWTCASSGEKDGYCDGWKRENAFHVPTHVMFIYRELQQDIEDMTSRGSSAEWVADWIEGRWEAIVNHYTPRKLSVLTDRILAISGIAQVFGSHMKDEYLAGLWKSTLPSFLCWRVASDEHERFPRPIDYQGPSWSWTGINGPIDFILARACDRDCSAQLLDVDIKLVNEYAKYGSVQYGILTLKGRLREATWHRNTTGSVLASRTEGSSKIDPNEEITMKSTTVYPDADDFEESTKTSSSIEVSLFEIGKCTGLKRRGPVGLVLRAMPCRATRSYPRFTRLGRTAHSGPPTLDLRHPINFFVDLSVMRLVLSRLELV
ncbi:heterokaryon incompatibility protein-domain-containing protein [Hypoxylon sp. FL1857]|nr:heterokaryon incompatibility protein-domain-containing protein [Hypoxylon sp. FL1857]